jgi:hypothetical protein
MSSLIDAPKHAASLAPALPLLSSAKYPETLAGVRMLFMTAQHRDTFITAGEV